MSIGRNGRSLEEVPHVMLHRRSRNTHRPGVSGIMGGCVAKFLSSSKKNVFYNRTRVKRVKDVLAFFRRICFCSNYTIIFDELKNFCNTTISPVFSTIVTTIWMLLLLSLCCLFRSGRLVSLPGEQLAVHRPGHSIRLSGLGYRRAALGADASGPVVVVQLM